MNPRLALISGKLNGRTFISTRDGVEALEATGDAELEFEETTWNCWAIARDLRVSFASSINRHHTMLYVFHSKAMAMSGAWR